MFIALTRLLVANNRGALLRLLGIVAGVAVGVALFLLLWGAYNGLEARDTRASWIQVTSSPIVELTPQKELTSEQALVSVHLDRFKQDTITRVDIAALKNANIEVPGIHKVPEPGTYYASAALQKLIEATPKEQLANRYGSYAGEIPKSALASPDSLTVITGETVNELRQDDNATVIEEFPQQAYGGSSNYQIIAIIGGIAILLPVLLLVGIVTDLGAAERRERFSALRLMGATPGVVARMTATETAITSFLGAIIGVILAQILLPVAAQISVNEGRLYMSDLQVSLLTIVTVVAVTVIASTVVSAYRIVRAGIGPLGATRQKEEKRPHFVSMLPLLIGVAGMVITATVNVSGGSVPLSGWIFIGGFILIAIGLILAGAYMTAAVSQLAARYAKSAATVVAMNRIRRTPRATFRSVSGLVLAVFIVTVFAISATTAGRSEPLKEGEGYLPTSTLIGHFTSPPKELAKEVAQLKQSEAVEQVTVGYRHVKDAGIYFATQNANQLGITEGSEGAFVAVNSGFLSNESAQVKPANTKEDEYTPAFLLISTDGSTESIEEARTAAENSAIHFSQAPMTRAENLANSELGMANSFANLANLGILIATFIAAISLAVATIASVLDRKRVLGLLRLMGMPVQALQRIIMSEALLPFITVIGICIGLGAVVAWAIVVGLTGGRSSISWPDVSYYVVLGVSIMFAILAVLATFRAARRNTGISTTRYE